MNVIVFLTFNEHPKTVCGNLGHPSRRQLLLHAPQTSLIPRPSHRPFLFASSFCLLEAVKNWTMGRFENNATPNHACSNLAPPPPTEQYHRHRFTASNRYTVIAQTRSSVSRHLAFTRIAAHLNRFEVGFKPPPRSGLQTGLRTGS